MKTFIFFMFVVPFLNANGQSGINYVYDNADRLTQVIDDNHVTTYGYDPNGNRISTTINTRVLPIQLLTFTATKQNSEVLLNWSTTQEINTAKFDVEFSIDGEHFQPFATVLAEGLQTKNNYFTLHCCPINGINYYRLKVIDKDGKFKYSDIRQVTFDALVTIKIYPNPLTNSSSLKVVFDKLLDKDAQVYIYSATGMKITLATFTKGQNSYPIQLPTITAGTYFIVVNTSNKIYQSTFVK